MNERINRAIFRVITYYKIQINEWGEFAVSNANITEEAIANTMKQLMEETPFDHITTADIINRCGISRKTFYYHFQDKYDLVNWIFSVEVIDGILKNTKIDNLSECYLNLCRYIRDNKTFCTNAINASGQNCFIQFLYGYVDKQINILCKDAINKKILSSDDIKFLIDYYYYAFIGVFKTWINTNMKDSPEVIVKRWVSLVDKNLEHYISAMGADKLNNKVTISS